jgi:hypothetical protein
MEEIDELLEDSEDGLSRMQYVDEMFEPLAAGGIPSNWHTQYYTGDSLDHLQADGRTVVR